MTVSHFHEVYCRLDAADTADSCAVGHFHVVHHFFPRIPFYHAEEATDYLRDVIGPYYMCSSKPVFQTLWDNYKFCQFVDDEGQTLWQLTLSDQVCADSILTGRCRCFLPKQEGEDASGV